MSQTPINSISSNRQKLAELIARHRAAKLETPPDPKEVFAPSGIAIQSERSGVHNSNSESPIKKDDEDSSHIRDKYGNIITLNSKQSEFVRIAGTEGKSAVLIGAAGTGKTTTQRAVVQELIHCGHAGILSPGGHKHLRESTPGIVICAYTRRAVANIKRNLPADLQANAITVHKLLEYQPVYDTVIDENSGEERTKMSFQATRHRGNPLPSSIRTIIVEEASMLGTDLFKELIDACPHNPQFIFLGDIQQLPPVFGPAILGFKLLELPVVELTEVYRQALESPIISLAHRILSGKDLPGSEFPQWKFKDQLTIHPWKKKIDALNALNTAGQFFIASQKAGVYDPEEDIILIPFNKSFGTDELNKIIANHLSHSRNEDVYQIIAGFNKFHCAVGDKVLFDKEDATIIRIENNPSYTGARPLRHSKTLDYWGYDSAPESGNSGVDPLTEDAMDFLLTQVAASDTGEDRVRQASHKIVLQMNDSEQEVTVNKASEINSMLLGYCLTVHKSQGSEWRKVFFVLHQSHATMVQRELLYTGVTRAREELYIICEPETFMKGITGQRVKGNTLEEKAEFFKGKLNDGFTLEA
jgi:exodeoxyribonuclease V alpha subunit